ncbi:hypothetical protein [Paenibacillus piri]|uniref:hypothetical protein n=1 Tax=Paenibacillus piri TaxID=2547395 RepID=UPI0014045F99|nr:hypothetical protein [Paenibacillus piri]
MLTLAAAIVFGFVFAASPERTAYAGRMTGRGRGCAKRNRRESDDEGMKNG